MIFLSYRDLVIFLAFGYLIFSLHPRHGGVYILIGTSVYISKQPPPLQSNWSFVNNPMPIISDWRTNLSCPVFFYGSHSLKIDVLPKTVIWMVLIMWDLLILCLGPSPRRAPSCTHLARWPMGLFAASTKDHLLSWCPCGSIINTPEPFHTLPDPPELPGPFHTLPGPPRQFWTILDSRTLLEFPESFYYF